MRRRVLPVVSRAGDVVGLAFCVTQGTAARPIRAGDGNLVEAFAERLIGRDLQKPRPRKRRRAS